MNVCSVRPANSRMIEIKERVCRVVGTEWRYGVDDEVVTKKKKIKL